MSKLSELVEGAYQVCRPCGLKYGRLGERLKSGVITGISTFHTGQCDICQRDDISVTEFRDYGYERKLLPREKFTKEHLEEEK